MVALITRVCGQTEMGSRRQPAATANRRRAGRCFDDSPRGQQRVRRVRLQRRVRANQRYRIVRVRHREYRRVESDYSVSARTPSLFSGNDDEMRTD